MGNICFRGGAEEKKADAFGEASDRDGVADRQSNIAAGEHQQQQSSFQQQQQQQQHSQDAALQQQGLAEPATSNTIDHNSSNANNNNVSNVITSAEQQKASAADERLKAEQRQQHEHGERIVQVAGRNMVPVRSPRSDAVGCRGGTAVGAGAAYLLMPHYQDQGFAAALAQHLEQTTKFADPLRERLPLPPPPRAKPKNSSNNNDNDNNNNNNGDGNDGGGGGGGGAVYACLARPEWEGIALGNKDGENPAAYVDHIAEQCLDAALPKKERLFANAPPIVENLL